MMYPDLKLPTQNDRPFFYANFVQTVDGKVAVTNSSRDYWPIGSEEDYDTLVGLRAHADVLVHGSHTARAVRTLDRLGTEEFRQLRNSLSKSRDLLYLVVSDHPDEELLELINNPPPGTNARLVSGQNLRTLSDELFEEGYKQVLVEGGPHLFASFVAERLVDELFVTIAPKLFGGGAELTLTMSEGLLLSSGNVPKLKFLSMNQHGDEAFLRYRVTYP